MKDTNRILTAARDYRVSALAPGHIDDARILAGLLRNEPVVSADPRRDGFYWVEGSSKDRFYVNVHARTQTVYLVAVTRISRKESPAEEGPVPCEAAC